MHSQYITQSSQVPSLHSRLQKMNRKKSETIKSLQKMNRKKSETKAQKMNRKKSETKAKQSNQVTPHHIYYNYNLSLLTISNLITLSPTLCDHTTSITITISLCEQSQSEPTSQYSHNGHEPTSQYSHNGHGEK